MTHMLLISIQFVRPPEAQEPPAESKLPLSPPDPDYLPSPPDPDGPPSSPDPVGPHGPPSRFDEVQIQ